MITCLWRCRELDVVIAGRTLVVVWNSGSQAAACVAVLGRNGAGKTLTLHTLAGLRPPGCRLGQIDGRSVTDWPRRELARHLGLLMQNYEHPFPSTVLSSVLIGRHPHIGFLQWEGAKGSADWPTLHWRSVGLQDFAERDVTTLSGGELRRLAIATVLAQDPDIVLLDEPANHLDLNHQLMTLRIFSGKARAGHNVLISLHDVNLALRFCDHALLLFGDGEWLYGTSAEVISEHNLSRLYQTPDCGPCSMQDREFYFAA